MDKYNNIYQQQYQTTIASIATGFDCGSINEKVYME